jgi:hypothetical protein
MSHACCLVDFLMTCIIPLTLRILLSLKYGLGCKTNSRKVSVFLNFLSLHILIAYPFEMSSSINFRSLSLTFRPSLQ